MYLFLYTFYVLPMYSKFNMLNYQPMEQVAVQWLDMKVRDMWKNAMSNDWLRR